ncbi:hypothetical protein DHEL01_v212789 [Diaporthe helianthi]|uniref:Alcohol dehydrogenase-like C-terminal domain-containing protein n=1 Tax=Diaporthe helianthi TaxID=158607 RepID=A0A2P5HEZ7_DIAHE|nr:hypothetical protein DHEL01_v212789 [Diaporthe helianthi]
MASSTQIQTQAIVCRPPQDGKRKWVLKKVALSPPADDEVIVEMVATGICHTDFVCGSVPDEALPLGLPPYPRVLGHEGPDSLIILIIEILWGQINFSGIRGAFSSLENPREEIGGSFFGQSSFSRLTRVKECSVVKVTDLIENDEQLKVLTPFGCGVQTGVGTITELANAQPADTIAVLGLGAVGLAAIMGAKIRGCKTIIGVDRVASRLELAKSLGATHTVDTGNIKGTLTDQVREITEGVGTTITVDASGAFPLIQQGVEFTANQGKSGKSIQGSMEGGVFPEKYIPKFIHWFNAGELPMDRLVKFYLVEDYLKAIKDMEDGVTIKPVLIW